MKMKLFLCALCLAFFAEGDFLTGDDLLFEYNPEV